MILPLLISTMAFACVGGELSPLIITPTKNYQVQMDRNQEVILDGGTQLPKITGIKGTTPKGKPMVSVTSGLQVLENGQMKSYPHRISLKLNPAEKDWERPIEVSFQGADQKGYNLQIQWQQAKGGCFKPVVK